MTRTVPAFPKPLRRQAPEYLRWIRLQPCLVDHVVAQAHHTTAGGVGTKGSDYRTVPLCWRHHGELHRLGPDSFQEKYGLDFQEEIIRLLERYVSALEEE